MIARPMMPIQSGDVVSTPNHGLARVLSMGQTSRGDVAWLRRYGGDRATIAPAEVSTLERTSLVTFALDDNDVDRLRELRRLYVAVGDEKWGPSSGALARYLRWAIDIYCSIWRDDPIIWTEVLYENIGQARHMAPLGDRRPLRVRLPVSLRNSLFELADCTRCSPDAVARAAIVQQLQVIYGDAPLDESDMMPERRLCRLPPEAAKNAIESIAIDRQWKAKDAARRAKQTPSADPKPKRVRIVVEPEPDTVAEQEAHSESEEPHEPPLKMEAGDA